MSGNDARFQVSVSPAPGAGESRRVYLKTWEVFVEGRDKPCARFGDYKDVRSPAYRNWDPYKHCVPRLRNRARKVQRTAYSHVDVGSGGSAVVVAPTELFRRDPVNITGRNYWVEVQDDVAYVVGGGSRAEVVTTAFDPAAVECWYGHAHYPASSPYAVRLGPIDAEGLKQLAEHGKFGNTGAYRSSNTNPKMTASDTHPYDERNADFNDDGTVDQADVDMLGRGKLRGFGYLLEVTRLPSMGSTGCLTAGEIEAVGAGAYRRVWTTCKVGSHDAHRYTDGRGGSHSHHHSYSHTHTFGDGNCGHSSYSSQTDGQTDADADAGGEAEAEAGAGFPDPGALAFTDVTATAMTLSWPERDVDHYLVYWAEASGGGGAQHAEVGAGTHSHTISGLKPGTVYAAIVYSHDYNEVTATGYQPTLAAARNDPLPCDAAEAVSRARAALRWHLSYGSDAALFWRILNTLGAEDLPARPSGVTQETVSAQYVKDFSSGRGWAGWTSIVEAMQRCAAAPDPVALDPEPDPATPEADPEVSITAGSGITEGGDALFTITARPAPSAPLTVDVTVAQSGDYGVTPGSRTVTIPTTGTAVLTVATAGDGADEADGAVTATINTGQGYTASPTAGTASVAVSDDDDPPPPPPATPEVSIAAGPDITEGGDAAFTVTASPAPASALTVSVSVSQSGDYGVTPGSRTVTIPTTGSVTLTVATADDSADEADGAVTATINTGTGYTASTTAGSATVAVADDDDPPPPPPPASKPTITVADATAAEGDGTIDFTVQLSAASAATITVYYSMWGRTATAYADYLPEWGSVTFAPGETSKTVRVSLIDDRTPGEGTETVQLRLRLFDTTHATMGDNQAQGTITDND